MVVNYSGETFHRLAKAIMIQHSCEYEKALEILGSFSLDLICDNKIHHTQSQQAAFLTAINTGKRAFLGGVTFSMPDQVKCLLPWPGNKPLNQIARELGAKEEKPSGRLKSVRILFGSSENNDGGPAVRLCSSGWTGGFVPSHTKMMVANPVDFALGGVLAAGISVSAAFLFISGLKIDSLDKPRGISLWNPSLNWFDENAWGPKLQFLPKKIWVLGLGHLGQAYLWNLGLLPYKDKPLILLQDYDKLSEANLSAALLSTKNDLSRLKTRICSDWLNARGIQTQITERKFDENTKPVENEPRLALCGFDTALARRHLNRVGFDYVAESGLGGDISDFDTITLHTFPSSKEPQDLWKIDSENPVSEKVIGLLSKKSKNKCGVLEVAQKAISTSFVGAVASSLVISEILRGLHGGTKHEFIMLSLRDHKLKSISSGNYSTELAKNGFLTI